MSRSNSRGLNETNQPKKKGKKPKQAPKKEMTRPPGWQSCDLNHHLFRFLMGILWLFQTTCSWYPALLWLVTKDTLSVAENTVSSFDEIVTGHLRLTWKKQVAACICRNNMFTAWLVYKRFLVAFPLMSAVCSLYFAEHQLAGICVKRLWMPLNTR